MNKKYHCIIQLGVWLNLSWMWVSSVVRIQKHVILFQFAKTELQSSEKERSHTFFSLNKPILEY